MMNPQQQQPLVNAQDQERDAARQQAGGPMEGMEELTRALFKQKKAGAELTGMDAQLMRVAKLRDTEYNDKGQYSGGGVGSAMGAMASFLDRGRAGKEFGELSQQMKDAQAIIGEGEATQEAHGLKRAAAKEQLQLDRYGADDKQTALTNAMKKEQFDREMELDWYKAMNPATSGSGGEDGEGFGKMGVTEWAKLKPGFSGLHALGQLRDQGIEDPNLYRQTGDGGGWAAGSSMVQDMAGKLAISNPDLASTIAGTIGQSDDPDAAVRHAQSAQQFQAKRELAFKGPLRAALSGMAVTKDEAERVDNAINLATGTDPKVAQENMDYLYNWAEDRILSRVQKSNMTKGQYDTSINNLMNTTNRETGEPTKSDRFQVQDDGRVTRRQAQAAPEAAAGGDLSALSDEELQALLAGMPE
jgi:hypothetical protein